MANELSITARMKVNKVYLQVDRGVTVAADMAGTHAAAAAQTIGTAEEALAVPADVATPGWAYFRNLDATNFVEVGVKPAATFYPFMKLKPGEAAVLRLGTAAPYARADTAPVVLEWNVAED